MDGLQEGYALGLDLGTTYSCIGVYRNGGVEIIPNRNGDRTTPSIVTILDRQNILKGEETLDHLVKDFDSSIYAIKRFIGRKYKDKDVINEINKENFPFKIVGDKNENNPLVLIDKNNEKIEFTLEEISSFIIRKMVDSAEAYLGKKVYSLVITVPANFNDAQRNCTKQAAKLAGVEVLRIINEPTAAALAYGLDEENQTEEEKKILVFDLGGGTFDVTILKINNGGDQKFEILSTKGDKFLGGEDFDNKLVEEVLDRFCQKMKESKEKIKEDKKAIKRLKIACEKIKRVLSNDLETTLVLSNFYNNNDIMETIKRSEFEDLSEDLFNRLKIPIEEALVDAKLDKGEINEIVMVGGSSRISKIKVLLNQYFNNIDSNKSTKNLKTKINDSINPDETVAYGATLMAAKILIKKDNNLSGFSLMDITPLSLGINVKNESNNPEIQKEGHVMSVLIKRGTQIPFTNEKTYQTSADNQTTVNIAIYEGERKYTKYNHLLGNVELYNLPKKKKGEVKIDVKFFVDVNGILSVTATEKSTGNSIDTKIKNDNVGLTDEDIEKIRKKNEELYKKIETRTKREIDYSNLKDTLKEFQDAYNESEDDEDKYDILNNYNEALEEFIDLFDKNFDNETMIEKYYIYVKQLMNSYSTVLNMKEITKENQKRIINKIAEYIKVFTQTSSGYLDDIIKVMENTKKKIFYEIITNVMHELNECGKQCLQEKKKFCRYYSLLYFEKVNFFFKKYIEDFRKLTTCSKELMTKCKNELVVSQSYINDINSNAIILLDESLNPDAIIKSNNTQFTQNIFGLKIPLKDEQEKYQIVLGNYEKMLIELSDKVTKGKALCIANIIKLSIRFLGDSDYKKYIKLAEECEFIVNQLNLDKNEDWYQEFNTLYKEIRDNYDLNKQNEKEMREKIKRKYKNRFDEIDSKFAKKKGNLDFINYILKLKPYPEYEEDKKNKNINFKEDSQDLISHLQTRYHPDRYPYNLDDEDSQLNYCIIEYIESYLNRMFNNIQ